MPTSADLRLLELLDKWLASLELHAKYSALDHFSYSKIQSWPEHQRPSRWIIDLAIQNTLTLQKQVRERIEQADVNFSESLELMAFLTNLVGSEHIERYIPLAEPAAAADLEKGAGAANGAATGNPVGAANATDTGRAPDTGNVTGAKNSANAGHATSSGRAAHAGHGTGTGNSAHAGHAAGAGNGAAVAAGPAVAEIAPLPPPPAAAPTARTAGTAARADGKAERGTPTAAVREQVIVDAASLVQAGRKWYELAEIISAMADRPHLTDVRRILKDNKEAIDHKAGRG